MVEAARLLVDSREPGVDNKVRLRLGVPKPILLGIPHGSSLAVERRSHLNRKRAVGRRNPRGFPYKTPRISANVLGDCPSCQ